MTAVRPGAALTPDYELVLTVRRPPGRAHVYRFARGPISLGRGATCGVHLPDRAISDEHLRFTQTAVGWVVVDPGSTHGTRLGGHPLPPGRPHPIQSADVLAVGPYLVEVFLDEGGGLTTDSRDTERLALSLASEVRAAAAGGWSIWVLTGPGAGATARIGRRAPLVVGSDPGADLVIPGADHRHLRFTLGRDGVRMHSEAPVEVRGQPVTVATVWPEDHVRVADSVLEVRGPPPIRRASRPRIGLAEVAAGLFILFGVAAFLYAWLTRR